MAAIEDRILADFVKNDIEFVTTVPCRQLAGAEAFAELLQGRCAAPKVVLGTDR